MHTARRIVGPGSLQQDLPNIVIIMNVHYQREICCIKNEIGMAVSS